ncbi:MAG: hypothetical protein QW641_00305 [Candidatus Aenigmatarchaeota archaeon]
MLSTNEIIKEFLLRGFTVTPEALEYLKGIESLEDLFKNIEFEKIPDKCITLDLLNKIFEKNEFEIIESDISINEISIESINKIIVDRFEFLRNLIKSKIEMVNVMSISNLKKNKSGNIIGIVIEVNNDNILVEDYTDKIKLQLDIDEKIFESDVFGFIVKDYKIKKVVYPDIPLAKSKKASRDVFVRFGYECNETPKSNNYYFFNNKKIWKNTIVFNNMLKAKIENDFLVLIVNENLTKIENDFEKEIISLVKKRNLNPLIKKLPSNALLLKEIPDFIVVYGNKFDNICLNYKGTTILYIKENTFVDINLKSREIYKNF